MQRLGLMGSVALVLILGCQTPAPSATSSGGNHERLRMLEQRISALEQRLSALEGRVDEYHAPYKLLDERK